MTRRAARILLFLVAALVLLAGSAWAAEESGGRENLFIAPVGWLFRWIHFILIFGAVAYLIAKKAPAYFRGRAERIVASISESAKVKEEADRKLREAEEKLARLDQELAELRESAQREAAAEGERLRALAQDEAQKIERAAQMEIQAAERAARMELKALAARLSVERAEAAIRQQMTPQVEAAILQSFVQSLGRSAS